MEEQGLNPKEYAEFVRKTGFGKDNSIESLIRNVFNSIEKDLGDKMNLSITTGLEHYTAIIADALFMEPIATNRNIAKG